MVRNQASAKHGLGRARRARRVGGADAARARHVGELSARRRVDAGDRDPVVGRDQAVAGVDQLGRGRRGARQEPRDGRRARLGLRVRGEGRLRHGAGDGGVADDVNAGHELRLERRRIDRAPAACGRRRPPPPRCARPSAAG